MNRLPQAVLAVIFLFIVCLSGAKADGPAPIKVGVTMALTGHYAKFGQEQLNGIKMWVDDINERGALLGRPVRLIYYNDQSDSLLVTDLYEKLIVEDRVDLLLNPYSSTLTIAASNIAEKHDIPMVVAASAPGIWARGLKNVFGVYTPADHNMDPIIALAADKGLTRIGLAYADTDFPHAIAHGVRARVLEHHMKIVFDESYPREKGDFAELIQRLAKTRPEVIIVGGYLNDAIAFFREARAQGLSPMMFAFSGGPALLEFGAALGTDEVEGVLSSTQWKAGERMPESSDFTFRFKRRYGHNASYQAAGGYAAGQVLEAAVRLAGSTRSDDVRAMLASMKFRSLLGHYRVDETGKQTGKPIYVLQWKNGRRRLVLPRDLAQSELIYPFQHKEKVME